jgi:hypothetical protein
MAAIPQVQMGIPIDLPPAAPVSAWRSERIQKIACYTLAALVGICSLRATVALAETRQVQLLYSTSLGWLLTGALVGLGRSIIDYRNPAVLAQLRREALTMTLPALVEKHGLQNLHRYTILSPFLFKQKFEYDTRAMRVDEILERYPLRDLVLFHILTPRQEQVLGEAGNATRTMNQRAADYKKEFETRLSPHDDRLRQERSQARAIFKTHPGHLAIAQINIDVTRGRLSPSHAAELVRVQEAALDAAKDLRDLTITQAEANHSSATKPIREHYQQTLANDRSLYDGHIDALTRSYRFG